MYAIPLSLAYFTVFFVCFYQCIRLTQWFMVLLIDA